jgi:hypothetical protein
MDYTSQNGRAWQEGLSTSFLTTDFSIRLKLVDIIFVFGSVLLCIIARSFVKKSIRSSQKKSHHSDRSYWNFLGLSQKFQIILQKNMPSVSGALRSATEPADRNFPSYEEFLAQYPSYGYNGEIDAIAADFPSRCVKQQSGGVRASQLCRGRKWACCSYSRYIQHPRPEIRCDLI